MRITLDEVRHIAALARLTLGDHELAGLQHDLEQILGYVDLLNELDTTGVEAFSPTPLSALPLQEDRAQPGLVREVALAQAPRSQEAGFAVPGFMDE